MQHQTLPLTHNTTQPWPTPPKLALFHARDEIKKCRHVCKGGSFITPVRGGGWQWHCLRGINIVPHGADGFPQDDKPLKMCNKKLTHKSLLIVLAWPSRKTIITNHLTDMFYLNWFLLIHCDQLIHRPDKLTEKLCNNLVGTVRVCLAMRMFLIISLWLQSEK